MEVLESFARLFWISLGASGVIGVWWFVMAYRRETWLRWTNAEAAFWRRTKMMPVSIIESTNRMEQSRGFLILIGLTFLLFILLSILSAGAYLYFRGKQQNQSPPNHQRMERTGE